MAFHTDICDTCKEFDVDIKSANVYKNVELAIRLKTERDIHKRKDAFYEQLRDYKQISLDKVETKLMNFKKNLPLLMTGLGQENYNPGIHDKYIGKAFVYIYLVTCSVARSISLYVLYVPKIQCNVDNN